MRLSRLVDLKAEVITLGTAPRLITLPLFSAARPVSLARIG